MCDISFMNLIHDFDNSRDNMNNLNKRFTRSVNRYALLFVFGKLGPAFAGILHEKSRL